MFLLYHMFPLCLLFILWNFNSIKNNSQRGKIISIPCNSILNNYELKNLNVCNSSPILHPRLNISGVFTWKQRSFVLIKKFIFILDYLVPTTRICIFKKNLTSILEHGNELLIFSVHISYTVNSAIPLKPFSRARPVTTFVWKFGLQKVHKYSGI